MSHTQDGHRLAGRVRPDTEGAARQRLTAADMRDDERGLALYKDGLTARKEVREAMARLGLANVCHNMRRTDHATRGVEHVFGELRALFAAGLTEDEARLVVAALSEYVDDLYTGAAMRDLDVLDVLDVRQEARENEVQMRRRCEGEQPTALELEAEECRRAATLDLERARALARRARTLRSGREGQRERVGLSAGGR